MKKFLLSFIIVAVVVIVAFQFTRTDTPAPVSQDNQNLPATSTPATGTIGETSTGKINQTLSNSGVVITPIEVTEDSRCAQGVQCIWAGTVKVKAKVVNGTQESTVVFELGKQETIGTKVITLADVQPYPVAGSQIKVGDYEFTFSVVNQ